MTMFTRKRAEERPTVTAIKEHTAELEQAIRDAERVAALENDLPALRGELERATARLDAALALGDEHPSYSWTAEVAPFGIVEMQPLKAVRTGAELARDKFQPRVDEIAGRIADIEAEIAALVGANAG
jgi:hypothetical protein